jgi:hypothetical protein
MGETSNIMKDFKWIIIHCQLNRYEMWGYQGGEDVDISLLGCNAV